MLRYFHIFPWVRCRFFYILPRFIEQVFTQNTDETKISLAYNFQKSPFFVVLLLKIAVFRNDFGEIRTVSDCLWRIAVYQASCLWRIADFLGFLMTHLIFDASYISRILDFLCNMLYMCSVFWMIFVQFLGVIKCLNNPYCAKCRIVNTKKPHRAIFKVTDSYLESGYLSKIYP